MWHSFFLFFFLDLLIIAGYIADSLPAARENRREFNPIIYYKFLILSCLFYLILNLISSYFPQLLWQYVLVWLVAQKHKFTIITSI
jgi:hypothetical protein